MPPTIVAQRDHKHLATRHLPTAHLPTLHLTEASEILWSTAPKSCMTGTFYIVVASTGTFDVTIDQTGQWSTC